MCGTRAHGSIDDALRNGGCAHEFYWSTLKPIKNGSPGNPFNERQKNFQPNPKKAAGEQGKQKPAAAAANPPDIVVYAPDGSKMSAAAMDPKMSSPRTPHVTVGESTTASPASSSAADPLGDETMKSEEASPAGGGGDAAAGAVGPGGGAAGVEAGATAGAET